MLQLSKKLREARTERGIRQKDLADYLGVAQNTVSAWERGASQIPVDTLQRIAVYFSISIADLTGEPQTIQEPRAFYGSEDADLRDIMARLKAMHMRMQADINELKERLKDKEEIIRMLRERNKDDDSEKKPYAINA